MERWTLFSDCGPVPSAPEQPVEPSGKPCLAATGPAQACCLYLGWMITQQAAARSGNMCFSFQAASWMLQLACGLLQPAASYSSSSQAAWLWILPVARAACRALEYMHCHSCKVEQACCTVFNVSSAA